MKYNFVNINNDNVNEIARKVLSRLLDNKNNEKDMLDLFFNEDEYINFMNMIKDCQYIENCGFIKTISGNVIMTIDGNAGGIKISKKGTDYLNNPKQNFIFL